MASKNMWIGRAAKPKEARGASLFVTESRSHQFRRKRYCNEFLGSMATNYNEDATASGVATIDDSWLLSRGELDGKRLWVALWQRAGTHAHCG